jgi:hypothetical protein
MRAISIKQPWASMIISGVKDTENRTFPLKEKGPIAICSTKKPNAEALLDFPGDYPNGVLLGVVDVVGLIWVEEDGEYSTDLPEEANVKLDWYVPGDLGWVLRNPRPCKQVPVKGQLGIYHIPDEIIEYL